MLLMDLASRGRVGSRTRLKFLTGKAIKYREIDVIERVKAIGQCKCQELIGIHNFAGADWGGKFVGITKRTWIDAYRKLDEEDHAVNCFRKLGGGPILTEMFDGEW